ncbi:glycosyl hydrolase [Chitinophagaceae bacterium LB-8]|uniref:Glycosyl hydrolase n=1 Tax=Paraflavisolibacter caeni TaxID=2982496 RepID=A0A9X2XW30_9BACT|nr:glycoside hydrolase family 30 protein [Paraflavisolibacter caeni]MCU7549702.1 glycosyl hydrolase [Paraflavisolibacter caeni]
MKTELPFNLRKNTFLKMALGTAFIISIFIANSQSAKPSFQKQKPEIVKVYTTAFNTSHRLSPVEDIQFTDPGALVERKVFVFVDDSRSFQTMLGIGGAITDASAETYAKLPTDQQNELLKAYYDPQNGIGYTLARTNMQSCDFSSGSYSYVAENDKELKTFNVKHDEQYRIPLIKKAIATAGKLTLYVSPWSPPAWMKDNNDMLHGGKLLPQYRQAWANFFVKYIKEYEKLGIPVWGLTVQNEPLAVQKWESCIFTAEEERDFIKNYLGPTLKDSGLSSKKLIAWDHNRDFIYQRANTILGDAAAAKYVWGLGYHWYETWTGGDMQFNNVKMVNDNYPEKNLLFTEGCADSYDEKRINDWSLGEKYGRSMIYDFNAGTVGWTDWNILLDEKGGPNHVGNYCFAPIVADPVKGLQYTNAYYYIGHFSKFIKPGAKRINASSNRSGLLTTAFKNTDGSIAVVVMNNSDQNIEYQLYRNGKAAQTSSLPHSISTFVFQSF